MNKLSLSAGLLAAGTLTFASIVIAAPASAITCTAVTTLSSLGVGNSCSDDGTWTFKLTGFSGFSGDDQLQISTGGPNFSYTLGAQSPWSTTGGSPAGNYTISYDLIAALPGRYFSMFSAQPSSTIIPLANNFATWKLTSANAPGQITSSQAGAVSTAAVLPYSNNTTLIDSFTGVLTVSGGKIQTVQSDILTAPNMSTSVPGPLPVLGAGAAYSFSRRLRRRIKKLS